MKRKDVDYKFLSEVFQKYFVVHELWAVKIRLVQMYVMHRMVYFER